MDHLPEAFDTVSAIALPDSGNAHSYHTRAKKAILKTIARAFPAACCGVTEHNNR
jgi:hypothetical protein